MRWNVKSSTIASPPTPSHPFDTSGSIVHASSSRLGTALGRSKSAQQKYIDSNLMFEVYRLYIKGIGFLSCPQLKIRYNNLRCDVMVEASALLPLFPMTFRNHSMHAFIERGVCAPSHRKFIVGLRLYRCLGSLIVGMVGYGTV